MKVQIGLLSLLLLWGQEVTGDLVVVSETGDPFRLYLNGEWVAETPVTRAEAHSLHQGPQRGIVYIHPTEGRIIQLRKTFYVEAGYVEYYALRKRKGQYVLALYNRVPLSQEPTPVPSPTPPTASPIPPSSGSGQTQTNTQQTTIIFNPTIQVQSGSGTQVNAPSSPSGAGQFPSAFPPNSSGYVGPCNCLIPMSRESFRQALWTLQRESFDQTRLEMAKQIARQNCLLAQDVKEMVALLEFESNRLALAKFAYDYTHDLSNYFVVAESFQFSSSRDELMRYMNSRSPRQQCQGTGGWGQSPSGGSAIGGGAPARPCTPCMAPAAFSQALTTVQQTASESARLEVARQIAATNCLSSTQVRDLCRAFSTESARLEFAKWAYTRSCDPQNYFLVNQAFTTTSSREELSAYIQSIAGR